jgi:hypothetical protein
MKHSIYDIVMSLPVWNSYGAVIIPHDHPPRLGFFPCFGATFTPEKVRDDKYNAEDVYVWDKNARKVAPYSPKPTERSYRSLKLHIKSPLKGDLVEVPASDPLAAKFPSQACFDPEFIERFSLLEFIEISDCLVGAYPLMFESTKERPIAGVPVGETVAVNFVIELAWKGHVAAMIQRAFWSDGYVGTYGCCG